MARAVISPEDWKKISDLVEESVKSSIEPLVAKSGWLRVANFLKLWGVITALWAVPLALLAFAGSAIYVAVARVDKQARFETTTSDDIGIIKKRLDKIDQELAEQSVSRFTLFSPIDFKNSLPELRTTIEKVRANKQSVPQPVLANIQQKLASTDSGVKEYWPTAAEFISYRSEQLNPLSTASLPYCIPKGTILAAGNGYRNCVIDLDQTKSALYAIQCTHCLVRYSGGRVNLTGFFFDCMFVVKVSEDPDKSGQLLEARLLDSNLKQVSFTLPKNMG